MDTGRSQNIAGERSISKAFIARYAAEAALRSEGVAGLEYTSVAALKERLGVSHDGRGVEVHFSNSGENLVCISVFPLVYYGFAIPEVAFSIQENVKSDLEKYTDLLVESVDVHVRDIIEIGEESHV